MCDAYNCYQQLVCRVFYQTSAIDQSAPKYGMYLINICFHYRIFWHNMLLFVLTYLSCSAHCVCAHVMCACLCVSGCFPFAHVLTLTLGPSAYVFVTVLAFDSLVSKISWHDLFFCFFCSFCKPNSNYFSLPIGDKYVF